MSPEEFPHIEYKSPKSAEAGEMPQHRFDLSIEGKVIGAAEMDYFSKPLPLYQLSELYVDRQHQGKRYASQIMDQVEDFLRERKKPGVLTDAILPGEYAQGMYERRGWKEVPGYRGFLKVFNWPDDVSLEILQGLFKRYADHVNRQAIRKHNQKK